MFSRSERALQAKDSSPWLSDRVAQPSALGLGALVRRPSGSARVSAQVPAALSSASSLGSQASRPALLCLCRERVGSERDHEVWGCVRARAGETVLARHSFYASTPSRRILACSWYAIKDSVQGSAVKVVLAMRALTAPNVESCQLTAATLNRCRLCKPWVEICGARRGTPRAAVPAAAVPCRRGANHPGHSVAMRLPPRCPPRCQPPRSLCRCGQSIARWPAGEPPERLKATCEGCGRSFAIRRDKVSEADPGRTDRDR